jgi:hypothetical protein
MALGIADSGGGASRGIFNQTAPSIWNADDPLQSLAESTGGSSEASDKASRLAQMYRRPFEIMKNVSLDEVVHYCCWLNIRLEMRFVRRNR